MSGSADVKSCDSGVLVKLESLDVKYNPEASDNLMTVFQIGKGFGLPLPWDEETPKWRGIHLTWEILIEVFLFYKLICAVLAFQIYPSFEENVFGSAVSIFQGFGFLVSLFYVLKRSGFEKILHNMDLLSADIMESGLGTKDFFLELYKLDASRVCKFAMFLTPCSVMCPLMFCSSVPVTGLIEGNYRLKLPVYNRCPFETNEPGAYEYLVIQQFLGFLLPTFQKLGHECVMLGLLRVQSAYFKALSAALVILSDDIEKGSPAVLDKLKVWVRLHQAILRNADDLVAFFSPVIVLYYICIISSVAGGVFYQLNAKEANMFQSNFLGMWEVICMSYLYLQCHVADELTTVAEKLSLQIYSIPWYKITQREKGFVRLVINMANRPVYMMAYKSPAFRLSREAYQAFFLNTVSAYMGFSKLQEIGD